MAAFRVKDFDRTSFPALYRCADDASLRGQRWYLSWLAVNLGLLVIGAVIGSLSLSEVGHKRAAQVIAALIFFAAMGTTILLATWRWERIWYAGRAVAESAKSEPKTHRVNEHRIEVRPSIPATNENST